MTERPILFQGAMVRALLAGTKTQTRRVVKHIIEGPHPPTAIYDWHDPRTKGWVAAHGGGLPFHTTNAARLCPYGQPGDRLWVRETWRITGDSPTDTMDMFDIDDVQYRADDDQSYIDKYRPSIHMPRRFSRILLEVTAVRVERLQEISEADAVAEGIPSSEVSPPDMARFAYRQLWDSINGAGAWEANPFVWVVSFKRVTP